ncbi:MAG TPA: hypothetical protein VGI93_22630 [Steroidobacteraceae bacterium]|jgi:hypothetical protein
MMERDAIARKAALARLVQSREELREVLDPPPPEPTVNGQPNPANTEFPRSRTMRALLSSRGLGAVGALVGGLLIARPAVALRLLRLVPASAVGKMLISKLIGQLRGHHPEP